MKRIWQLALVCLMLVLVIWGAKKVWLKVFPQPKENLPLHLLLVTGEEITTSQYLSPFDWQSRKKDICFLWGDNKVAPGNLSYIDLTDRDHWQAYLKGQSGSPQELLYTAPQWTFWPDDSTRQNDQIAMDQILAIAADSAGIKEAAKNAGIIKTLAEYRDRPAGGPTGPGPNPKPSQ